MAVVSGAAVGFAGLLIPMVLSVYDGYTMTIYLAPAIIAVLAALAFCVQLTIAVLSGYDAKQ
jgi:hypothetical protein